MSILHPLFTVRYDKPGSEIWEGTLPGAESHENGKVHYVVSADSTDLDKPVENAEHGTSFAPSPPKRTSTTTLFVAINLLVIVVVAGTVWYRRLSQ